ncbi:MAG: AMP-binding protein [Syntrophobacterales bacterium]|jgi:phenylacetate-CoA ligase|nr:AMP-binding protein [Syntrophobacterales bacterium]
MRHPEIEAMDRGELELLQLERLQSTLTRAYRQVKFYRRQFDRLGLNLDDFKSLADLARLPYTTREDLSENYPYGLFAVPLRDIVRILSSPGTTEKPLVVGYAAPDVKLWQELLARLYTAAGISREDIVQLILPPGLANWRRDLQAGAEYLGASVIPPATLNFAKELMVMRDYKTSVLVTTPPLARHLLAVMARMDLTPAELSLRQALLVASPLSGEVRQEIEQGFQVKTATAYGITEVMGPGLAFSCGADGGLHFSEDHFYPEIIDPDSGGPVPSGATGELVITTLSTVAFPLVRFRSGDRTSLLQTTCPCGRTLARLGEITGRTDTIFAVGGIKVHPDQINLLIQEVMGGALPQYRHRVVTEKGLEVLEIDLIVAESFFSDEIKTLETLCRRAQRHLQENLGINARITLKELEAIER